MIIRTATSLLVTIGACWAGACTGDAVSRQPGETDANRVETILTQLQKKVRNINSYQGQVHYEYRQPLLESKSVRKGVLYYAKLGKTSKLRVNFETLKQDDEKEQEYKEHFIFDGVWLTQIDYQIKAVKLYQMTEANQPVDAFELASKNLPIIGFSKIEDLKKHFEIKLIESKTDEQKKSIHLHLKTKPGSPYRDRYSSIDFWIDKKLSLPAKVVAVTPEPEEDIYEIRLLKPRVNKEIDEKVFDVEIPPGFGEPEIIPLKKKDK
jgi:outer membrane lipoprotein-sorting protein